MVTRDQIQQFEQIGAVTVDAPFTDAELDAAEAAFDRLVPFEAPPGYRVSSRHVFAPELVDVIQHPFLEECSKAILCAPAVELFAVAAIAAYPHPTAEFAFSEHVDIKYSLGDLDATPKRMFCSCLVWFSDATADNAPLMYRPGSHRLLGEDMERNPTYVDDPAEFDELPDLPWTDPEPLLAKRGQVSLTTTGMVHGGSVNVGKIPRKVLFVPFLPRGMDIRGNMKTLDQRLEYYRKLRPLLRPERRHIVRDEPIYPP